MKIILSRPQFPIQAAVVDGFGKVADLDVVRAFQVGDGAGHAQDAVVSAGGQAQVFHGRLEQTLAFLIQSAMTAELFAGHAAIEALAVVAESLLLRLAGAVDLGAHASHWSGCPAPLRKRLSGNHFSHVSESSEKRTR